MTAWDPMTRIVYLTRLPPSPSGVALYARDFVPVLESLGIVRTVRLPDLAADSQRVSTTLRAGRRTGRAMRAADLLVVELAGRGVAEFWVAWWQAVGRRRRVVVNIHDAPTLSGGGPFLFTMLDRRYLQRIASMLSRTIGFRAERALLRAAALTTALSPHGAVDIAERYSVSVPLVLPHVLGAPTERVQREPLIFIPGAIASPADVSPVLRALADVPEPWRVVIGYCSEETARECLREAVARGVADRVEVTGLVDEGALDRQFARASIVVRWRASGWTTKAVSGPVIRALGRGCAVISNDRRGTQDCLRAAGAGLVGDDPDEVTARVIHLVAANAERDRLGVNGLQHIQHEHTPAALARLLAGALMRPARKE